MTVARRLVTLAVLASVSLAIGKARAEDLPPATPVSPGPEPQRQPIVETSPRWALVGAGATVFGLSYGVSVLVAISSSNVTDVDHSAYGWMAVPIAGPFIAAATAPTKRDERITLPALGVAQVIGVGLAAAGFVFPRARVSTRSAARVELVPGGPATSAGLTAIGTF